MFCPNCGANNTTEQKFCRSCGLNLEETTISLLEQIPKAEYAGLRKHERMLEKFGNIAFTGFSLAVFVGITAVIYVIFTKMVLTGNQPFAGLLLIAFIFFAGLALTYVFFAETLKGKRDKLNPRLNSQTAELIPPKSLPDNAAFQPATSVIENTTELLNGEKKPL